MELKLIETKEQLIGNINYLERCLAEGNEKAKSLVKRGTHFVAYQVGGEWHFAPSRLIGYIDQKIDARKKGNGTYTDKAISKLLFGKVSYKPVVDVDLESSFQNYCSSLGIKPPKTGNFGAARKYWRLDGDIVGSSKDKKSPPVSPPEKSDTYLLGEFPEGKEVERTHKMRERNSQAVKFAKENFKKIHGHLVCEVCGFDFEKNYGDVGKDYIEGHHTIPVSEMKDGHITKVEDIAMLCANCHRMAHRTRPWLTKRDLVQLTKEK